MRVGALSVRLYGLLIRCFPASFHAEFGEEMTEAFAAQLRDAVTARRRAGALLRAFVRLLPVIMLEWRDTLRARRHMHGRGPRRGFGMSMMPWLVKQGVRSLVRRPAFTFGVVLLLGLGVGSVSAIYAVVDHVLLRALPYPDVERLIVVENGSHSGPAFEDFGRMRSVDLWAAARTDDARLIGSGNPLQIVQTSVSADFFAMFGARPHLGRLLVADDFRTGEGVVLSHGAWRRIWGGDAGVIGRTILLDDRPVVVLGVLDPSFSPPEALTNAASDVWRPIDPADGRMRDRHFVVLSVAGRLSPGTTLESAASEAARLAEERARSHADNYVNRDGTIAGLPVIALQEATVGSVRRGLGLLFGAVTLLLLVACANVTHLFLARGVARVREMSVRRALGAGTGALAAQLLVESMLLGLAGAAVGIALARLALGTIIVLSPGGLPRAEAIALDLRVLAFAALVGVLTAVVFGLLPALRLARGSVGEVLRGGGRTVTGSRGAQAARSGIVIAEIALSLVLIAQAGWLLRSFIRLQQQPLGFRTESIATIPLTPTGIETSDEWYRRMEGVRAAIAQTPGVRAATFGLSMPLQWTGGGRCCMGARLDFGTGGGGEGMRVLVHPVDADYFEIFELQLVAGRTWTRAESRATPRPVVATEPLAVQAFGSARDAIGRTFELAGSQVQIIGVVGDNRHYGVDQDHGPAVYRPITDLAFVPWWVHMAVLTASSPPPDLPARLRAAVWRAEPELPVPTIRSMADWANVAIARQRFDSALFTAFAVVALLLVVGGLSGTLLYTVSLERRDLGIRLALGATRGQLERRVLVRGFGMAAAGAALGGAGAWAAGRLLESRLFGVDARDFRTLFLASAVLLLAALASSWVPARRAARTDPMDSLRTE